MKKITTLADHQITGNSASITKIGEQSFTITVVNDSNYAQGVVAQMVKITTKEMFDVNGNQMNKFHTTRELNKIA